MHRDIRIRPPVADHHLRPDSSGRNMQPFGITAPAFFLLDIFFIDCKISPSLLQFGRGLLTPKS